MKKTIRLTESDLNRIIKEAVSELNASTYNNYWKGRAAQSHNERELSPARIRRGERDMENVKNSDDYQRYKCNWLDDYTGERYAKDDIDNDVYHRNLTLRAGQSGLKIKPQYGTEELYEAVSRVIRKYLR